MKKVIPLFTPFLVLSFLAIVSIAFAGSNNLYLPLNIQKAYEKGTRSYDGKPGPNYWQNSADYQIDVELIPEVGLVTGSEQIVYHNNSPDTLDKIIIRLYQDIYKKGNPRDFPVDPEDLTDGVELHYLKVGDDTLQLTGEDSKVHRRATNLVVPVPDSLFPGQNLKIDAKWSFKVPDHSTVRMGQYSETDFFMAYWYPQIAVYDDIDGWDRHGYLGYVEFYNDFNNYEVSVTVPGDYLVWTTGLLQNPDAVLQEKVAEKYRRAFRSDKVIRIVEPADYENQAVTRVNRENTWRFTARKVPDFTFAVSNHYRWDAASLVVDDSTGRRVMVAAVYPDSAAHYEEAVEVSRQTVEYLSKVLPGIPFPYPKVTTFCNGHKSGGMESPMMANDGAPKKRSHTIGLIFHEISHNYFPFYMGINERKYAWMDEGWASFLPREIVDKLEPESDYLKRGVNRYLAQAGNEAEMPVTDPSYLLRSRSSYRTASYYRPALAYTILQDLLGKESFKHALQEYIRHWNGKHPIPQDFFSIFNNVTGENLSWFWEPWFYQQGYPDLAIGEVTTSSDNITVKVEKVGRLPVPVVLTFYYEDDSTVQIARSARIWQNGNTNIEIEFQPEKHVNKIVLGNSHIPDVNKENNTYRSGTDSDSGSVQK